MYIYLSAIHTCQTAALPMITACGDHIVFMDLDVVSIHTCYVVRLCSAFLLRLLTLHCCFLYMRIYIYIFYRC